MAIFDCFAREKRELSNSEVARLLDIAETSSLDLLHTLVEQGYLSRTMRTRRFYPTGRLLTMARRIADNDAMYALAADMVATLVEATGETALVGRLERNSVRVVALQEGHYELRYVQRIGTRVALHASAMGRALLAASTPPEALADLLEHSLPKLTEYTLTTVAQLKRAIEVTRARGWAIVDSEGTEGVAGLAVAARIGEDWVGIAIAGPSLRIKANAQAYLRELGAVQQAANSGSIDPARRPRRKTPVHE